MRAASRPALALLLALALGSAVAASRIHRVSAADELVVALLNVDDSAYPEVRAEVSVVNRATGAPEQLLTAQDFSVKDVETGADAQNVRVTPGTSPAHPAATTYVLLIDTSSGAAPHLNQVRDSVLAFYNRLGSNDTVHIVYFNAGAQEQTSSGRANDPNIVKALEQLATSKEPANLDSALRFAANLAAGVSTETSRRAVVLFTAIDDGRAVPALTPAEVTALHVPFYVFGFGAAANTPSQALRSFLESDLVKPTVGAYEPGDTDGDAGRDAVLDLTQRVYTVQFRTEVLPDGASHPFSVSVTNHQQSTSGEGNGIYKSGTLESVSPITIAGLDESDDLTDDRDIKVSLGGKAWPSYTLQLFRDCDPARCPEGPVATSTDRALEYRVAVGPLDQGDHTYAVIATARDGAREFTSAVTPRTITRSGTTYNFPALVLFGGVALAAVAVTVIAARRRRMRLPGGEGPRERAAA